MTDEMTVLEPNLDTLTLSDGTVVRLLDLKARQFFKLLKILTHGPAMQLMASQGTGSLLSGSSEDVLGRLVGFIGISIPDAFDEAADFLFSMVEPADLKTGNDKLTRSINNEKIQHLAEVMSNPDLEDMLDLVETIVKRESADLAALGKKVASLLKVAEKTGQLDISQTSPAPSTSADSVEPSTLSSVATADTL